MYKKRQISYLFKYPSFIFYILNQYFTSILLYLENKSKEFAFSEIKKDFFFKWIEKYVLLSIQDYLIKFFIDQMVLKVRLKKKFSETIEQRYACL